MSEEHRFEVRYGKRRRTDTCAPEPFGTVPFPPFPEEEVRSIIHPDAVSSTALTQPSDFVAPSPVPNEGSRLQAASDGASGAEGPSVSSVGLPTPAEIVQAMVTGLLTLTEPVCPQSVVPHASLVSGLPPPEVLVEAFVAGEFDFIESCDDQFRIVSPVRLRRPQKRSSRAVKSQHFEFRMDCNSTAPPSVPEPHMLSPLVPCPSCGALKWVEEKASLCCSSGRISLPLLHVPPEPLYSLLNGLHPASGHFLRYIRRYNSVFTMASFSANIERFAGGPANFKISGVVHHHIGSLVAPGTSVPVCAQVYVLQTEEQQQVRLGAEVSTNLRANLLLELGAMLQSCNPFVREFQAAGRNDTTELFLRIAPRVRADPRRYNRPTTAEIALFIPDQSTTLSPEPREIIVRKVGGGIQRLNELNGAVDPLPMFSLRTSGGGCGGQLRA